MIEIFSKENIFWEWNLKENTVYVFVPSFRVNIAKDIGEVQSTSASTSESYSV